MSPQLEGWQKEYEFGHFVISPESEVADEVNALRAELDPRSASYSGAHITLSCPLKSELTESKEKIIKDAICSISAFTVDYGPVKNFPNSKVLYFQIEPAEKVLAIREALHSTDLFYPHTAPYEFVPHMTIREVSGEGTEISQERMTEIRASHCGSFFVESIDLILPNKEFVFSVSKTFTLGKN